jgi:type III secretion protein HrpB1
MQQAVDPLREQRTETISSMLHALGDEQLDQAQAHLDRLIELTGLAPDHPDIVLFNVIIQIQRGQGLDALRYLNGLDEQHCPDVKALCMYFLQDPLWESLATDLADNDPRPHVRESMALLIGRRPGALQSGAAA